MSNLIVMRFENQQEARNARKALIEGESEGNLRLGEVAFVQTDEDGNIDITLEIHAAVEVHAGGGILGPLISFMLAGPLANIIIGAAGGAVIGSLTELGIETKFVMDVVKSLQPGSSALFVIVRDADTRIILAALKPYEGELFQTTLSSEAQERMRSSCN